tara:strand:+ start:460 stop:774 length:315 start_codon:yes stop_codon:yes gene_type:complete
MNELEKKFLYFADKYTASVSFVNKFERDGTATISRECSVTNEEYSVTVKASDWFLKVYKDKTVQSIWPDMNSDDREFIISGMTPAEWDSLYGDAYGKYVANLNA